jgi:hypothetical protein
MKMSLELHWNDTDRGKPKKKNMSYQKPYTDWFEIEPESPQ